MILSIITVIFQTTKQTWYIYCPLGPHISLWMKGEALLNCAKSIRTSVGQQGQFKVKSYEIMRTPKAVLLIAKGKLVYNWNVFLTLLISGSCRAATETRRHAVTRKFRTDTQHMTVEKFIFDFICKKISSNKQAPSKIRYNMAYN